MSTIEIQLRHLSMLEACNIRWSTKEILRRASLTPDVDERKLRHPMVAPNFDYRSLHHPMVTPSINDRSSHHSLVTPTCENRATVTPSVSHKSLPLHGGRQKCYSDASNAASLLDENLRDSNVGLALCKLLRQQGAPDVDLDVFSGDPLDFKYFMSTFEEVVENKIKDLKGRLTRLIKYTRGEAKDLVKHCIHRDGDACYSYAKELLEKRYGDPYRILAAYRKELSAWKQIKYGDSSAYRKFYSFLIKCNSLVEGKYWNNLDSADNLCTLVYKLPGNSRERWNRRALNIRSKTLREPRLNDFISFVDEETILVSDPLFSKEALEGGQRILDQLKVKSVNVLSKKSCFICNKSHVVEDCERLKRAEMKERIKLISTSRLCFGCLGKNHLIKDCKRRKSCSVCKEDHPTILHGFRKKKDEDKDNKKKKDEESTENSEDNTTINNGCTEVISCNSMKRFVGMSIVSVELSHPSSQSVIRTFALLDNCSEGTFVLNEVLEQLNVRGRETKITVKTMNNQTTEK